jgi:hypothetical protein
VEPFGYEGDHMDKFIELVQEYTDWTLRILKFKNLKLITV